MKKTNKKQRVIAAVTLLAMLCSLFLGFFAGIHFRPGAQTIDVAGILLADASASTVYTQNDDDTMTAHTLLTISVDNAQDFDFVEVEWDIVPTFNTPNLLHWGAEKLVDEQFTVTNEMVDIDADKIYVRIRATVDGTPSPWSNPTEVIIRETEIIEEDTPENPLPVIPTAPVTETQQPTGPVETQQPTGPVETEQPKDPQNPSVETPVHTHTTATREVRKIQPTCLQAGVAETETYCTECHIVISTDSTTIPALGHDYVEIERVEPMVGKTGYVVYECTRCGDRYTVTLPALVAGHTHEYSIIVNVKNANCTQSGVVKMFCTCNEFVEQYVAPLGHDMGSWHVVKTATEFEDGIEERNCSRCSYTETRAIAALGCKHTHTTTKTNETTPATCTTAGSKTIETICSSCNAVIDTKTVSIPALGHAMGDWYVVTEATEFENGVERRDCGRCDYNETRNINATGCKHTHTVERDGEIIPATCTTAGSKTIETVCSSCNAVIDTQTVSIPALGHAMGDWYVVTEATVSENGVERRDCDRCDYNETRDTAKRELDTSNVKFLIQTFDMNRDATINFTVINRDIDYIEISVTNDSGESDLICSNVPNTGALSFDNYTTGTQFTKNGTYTAVLTGYKTVDGQNYPVSTITKSIVIDELESNATATVPTTTIDTTTDITTDTTDTEDTTVVTDGVVENNVDETVDTVETVETVEIVETVETAEVAETATITLD